jgi:ubiquinone/menaquinone biosynthesis C-methylase UbiE
MSRISSSVPSVREIYREKRKAHWDTIANVSLRFTSMNRCYHEYLVKMYRFLVPAGLRVLEVGCGQGDLVAKLAPAEGVGLDFSRGMLKKARQAHPDILCLKR